MTPPGYTASYGHMNRVLTLLIVLVLSGVPAITSLCNAWCVEPASPATAGCHEHSTGPEPGHRMGSSRSHQCDHLPAIGALAPTEGRQGFLAAPTSEPAAVAIAFAPPQPGVTVALPVRESAPHSRSSRSEILRI